MQLPLFTQTLIYPILGFIVPGWGHAAQGRLKQAALIQAAFYIAVFAIAISRLIVTIPGIYSIGLIAISAHVYSTVECVRIKEINRTFEKKMLAVILIYPTLCLSVLLGVFFLKPYLLGIQTYKVRSISMEPTLQDGDVILVDTWKYYFSSPSIGEVVLFQDPTNGYFKYIKRISEKPPEHDQTDPESVFVLGDNYNNSIDSRHFGAIPRKLIKGQAKAVLIGKLKIMNTID